MKNKIIEFIKTLYSKHVQRFLYKLKEHWIFYSAIGLTAVYLYGMIVSSFINAVHNFATNTCLLYTSGIGILMIQDLVKKAQYLKDV